MSFIKSAIFSLAIILAVSWASAQETGLNMEPRSLGTKGKVGGILVKGLGEHALGTALLAGPAVIGNAKVAAGAAALPAVLAAKGALVGKAIAAPIIKGAVINSIVATKIAGKLVAIPVAIKTGVKLAALKTALLKKAALFKLKKAALKAALLKKAILVKIAVGAKAIKLALLKPIAIAGGLKLKAIGAGAGLVGKALKAQGAVLLAKGAATELGALKLKGAGAKLIGLGIGGPKLIKGAIAAPLIGAAAAAGLGKAKLIGAGSALGKGQLVQGPSASAVGASSGFGGLESLVLGSLTHAAPELLSKFHTAEGLLTGASPDIIGKLNVLRKTLPATGGHLVAGPLPSPAQY
jgi:hypothetical protein